MPIRAVRLTDQQVIEIDRIALARSEPGKRVSAHRIMQEAIERYLSEGKQRRDRPAPSPTSPSS